MLEPTLTFGKI